jgi:hypothetical protein
MDSAEAGPYCTEWVLFGWQLDPHPLNDRALGKRGGAIRDLKVATMNRSQSTSVVRNVGKYGLKGGLGTGPSLAPRP